MSMFPFSLEIISHDIQFLPTFLNPGLEYTRVVGKSMIDIVPF
jgi:hypothetical protein